MTTPPVPTAKRSPVVCHGHSRPIVEINYSVETPEGYYLASASKDGKPMLRFGATGDWYGTFEGHKGAVWSCVLDNDALKCATGSGDYTARVWDACAGLQLHMFQHDHIVRSVNFSHSGQMLATGGMEKVIRIFDLAKPEAAPSRIPGAPTGLRCLTWLGGDSLLLCSYTDKPGIGVYDTRTLTQVQTLETAAPVSSIELTYDSQHLTVTDGQTIRFMAADGLRLLKELPAKYGCESVSFAPGRRRYVSGGADMWVHVFDYDTGQEIECHKGHHGPIHTLRWSPTYESYASGSEDGTIRIWSPEGAAPPAATPISVSA